MKLDAARQILLEHSRSKMNGVFPGVVNCTSKLTNPLCGDHVELRIYSDGQHIHDLGHKANACALCLASASLLCLSLKGETVEKALQLCGTFQSSLTEPPQNPWPVEIAKFECFENLRVNRSRRMCAALPWVVLKSALEGEQEISS